MRRYLVVAAMFLPVLVWITPACSQSWTLGGNMGLSSFDGSAGFHFTPMAELHFTPTMGIGSEFSINTQFGAPMIWYPFFRYHIGIRGSALRPYANAGPVLAFNFPNGPSFGFLFGGGVNIPIANNLSLAPDVLLGPVFGVGGGTFPILLTGYYWGHDTYGLTSYTTRSVTVFAFSLRWGIRYEL